MSGVLDEQKGLRLSKQLREEFTGRFGGEPTHAVWSPGRVNLIGEHTDYNFLPVLPMAIAQGITFAMRPNRLGRIRIANLDPHFPAVDFELSDEIPKSEPGHWGNYVKAPVQRMTPVIREALGECRGFDAVAMTTLPSAAGLSSSSALVVGVYTCLAAANGFESDLMEVAEFMRQSERYVGTAGGGMDQATITLGREGRALKIDFAPLRTQEVQVPDEVVFFAVDSLERAEKSGAARGQYNRRVFECHAAASMIARQMPAFTFSAGTEPSLADVYREMKAAAVPLPAAVLQGCPPEAMSFAALYDRLDSRVDDLLARAMLPPASDPAWENFSGFLPFARASHVLEETERVERCARALDAGDVTGAAREMNASHASCRDLYHISTPTLERLVADAMACGALAARITGAGFGGSIVVMVPAQSAPFFREQLWQRHYRSRVGEANNSLAPEKVVLECRPARGAYAQALDAGK